MIPAGWLYNGHLVYRNSRSPELTDSERRALAEHFELGNKVANLADPTDPIALARRLWDQIATRHMEALDHAQA